MDYLIDSLPDFEVIDHFLSDSECNELVKHSEQLFFEPSQRYNGDDEKFRKSLEFKLQPSEPVFGQLLEKIWGSVVEVNCSHFNFSISGFQGDVRYIKYQAPDSHFSWHIDRGAGIPVRKLSFSLQLSQPSDYEGGELQIMDGAEIPMPKTRGSLIIFPSYVLHRVTPVIRGQRHAIVGWITGEQFR
jgi:PKHD-type hydroxylase